MTRWHLIWLLIRADEPRTPAQAAVVGVSVITARAVLRRWNADGLNGRTDRRAGIRGRSRLTDDQWVALFAAPGRRAVDRAEGGRVRPRPVGRPGRPADREAVANRLIGRIDRLRAILRSRLACLASNPSMFQPFLRFHWTRCLEW